jgi:hypothetical protein
MGLKISHAPVMNAALDNGVGSVKMSSCWRPMFGSIAHRLGLGPHWEHMQSHGGTGLPIANSFAGLQMELCGVRSWATKSSLSATRPTMVGGSPAQPSTADIDILLIQRNK